MGKTHAKRVRLPEPSGIFTSVFTRRGILLLCTGHTTSSFINLLFRTFELISCDVSFPTYLQGFMSSCEDFQNNESFKDWARFVIDTFHATPHYQVDNHNLTSGLGCPLIINRHIFIFRHCPICVTSVLTVVITRNKSERDSTPPHPAFWGLGWSLKACVRLSRTTSSRLLPV